MTEYDLRNQIADLLQLSGTEKTEVPGSQAAREVLLVKLISEALSRGATWSQIGLALNGSRDGKFAKKVAKRLARNAQRSLLRRRDLSAEPE